MNGYRKSHSFKGICFESEPTLPVWTVPKCDFQDVKRKTG